MSATIRVEALSLKEIAELRALRSPTVQDPGTVVPSPFGEATINKVLRRVKETSHDNEIWCELLCQDGKTRRVRRCYTEEPNATHERLGIQKRREERKRRNQFTPGCRVIASATSLGAWNPHKLEYEGGERYDHEAATFKCLTKHPGSRGYDRETILPVVVFDRNSFEVTIDWSNIQLV